MAEPRERSDASPATGNTQSPQADGDPRDTAHTKNDVEQTPVGPTRREKRTGDMDRPGMEPENEVER